MDIHIDNQLKEYSVYGLTRSLTKSLVLVLASFAFTQTVFAEIPFPRPSNDDDNSGFIVLDQIEFDYKDSKETKASNIFPSLPTINGELTETHDGRGVSTAAETRYFDLMPVASKNVDKILERLKPFDLSQIFGCFHRSKYIRGLTRFDGGDIEQRVCHYTRSIDLSLGHFATTKESINFTEMSPAQRATFNKARRLGRSGLNVTDESLWRRLYLTSIVTNDDGTRTISNYTPLFRYQYGTKNYRFC